MKHMNILGKCRCAITYIYSLSFPEVIIGSIFQFKIKHLKCSDATRWPPMVNQGTVSGLLSPWSMVTGLSIKL